MIEAKADGFHAISHVEVIAISMHIPHTSVAGMDGDITAAGFTQTACLQQKFANSIGLRIV